MEVLRNLMPDGLPVSLQVVSIALLASAVYSYFTRVRPNPAYPLITVRGLAPRRSWMLHCDEVLEKGLKTGGPFQVMSSTGLKTILPSKYADEIRNLPQLNFSKFFAFEFPVNYPGYEPHKEGISHEFLVRDTVRMKLTQSLGLVTRDLVDETIATVDDVFGTGKGWTTRLIRVDMLEVVARASSRVFLGAELCRNRRWLEIAKTYTVDSFMLAQLMRVAPAVLRPLTYLLLPHSSRLRKSVRDARAMIVPEIKKRQEVINAARAAGLKPPKISDTLGWMYDVAKGRDVDFVSGQLSMTMAAIHTTTEGLCRALMDLCKYPAIVDQLREEIISVVGGEGWSKTTLYKLRLMDSFLKESQRMTPFSKTSMNRYIESELILSDGHTLPKDTRVTVVGDFMNADIYPQPEVFDAARFLKKRQEPGQENHWQFATTSASHLSFGHGEHACPGRFFASNEMKIILCHLLIKFDWRFVPDLPEPANLEIEASLLVQADTKIQACRRKPEIDIDA
ncbi:cytochrome P450 [Xylaria sp. CBS 124048]|nr:cytochrome P450 [Xylaria sp. CBS 124048]